MPSRSLSISAVASVALREAFTRSAYWGPAFLLLTPTLVLQLAAPTYLRTRLAPSPWTVAAGALVLVWLAQVAFPAVCALVHARRTGTVRTLDLSLIRLSVTIGIRVTLGLAAVVVPGLWLQARYAFVPLADTAGAPSAPGRADIPTGQFQRARARLLLVGCGALVVSMLGQSAVAAAADALGTITAAGEADGRTIFQLHLLPHAITTIVAYLWSTAMLVVHALSVSVLFDDARGVMPAAAPNPTRLCRGWIRVGQVAAAVAGLGALLATIYKVDQHLR